MPFMVLFESFVALVRNPLTWVITAVILFRLASIKESPLTPALPQADELDLVRAKEHALLLYTHIKTASTCPGADIRALEELISEYALSSYDVGFSFNQLEILRPALKNSDYYAQTGPAFLELLDAGRIVPHTASTSIRLSPDEYHAVEALRFAAKFIDGLLAAVENREVDAVKAQECIRQTLYRHRNTPEKSLLQQLARDADDVYYNALGLPKRNRNPNWESEW